MYDKKTLRYFSYLEFKFQNHKDEFDLVLYLARH